MTNKPSNSLEIDNNTNDPKTAVTDSSSTRSKLITKSDKVSLLQNDSLSRGDKDKDIDNDVHASLAGPNSVSVILNDPTQASDSSSVRNIVATNSNDKSNQSQSFTQQRPYPPLIQSIRKHLFKTWLGLTFLAFLLFVLIDLIFFKNFDLSFHTPTGKAFWNDVKFASIPVFSILFTWYHVWLGLQMCFYPVHWKGIRIPFCGLEKYQILGWQGIVPRRAQVMAERSCDIMVGRLITVEEIIDRIQPEEFFDNLYPVLRETQVRILKKVGQKYWPRVWSVLPESVKEEVNRMALEETEKMFVPIIEDLKQNLSTIFDIKQMCIYNLTSRRELLVELFQQIGKREFRFVLHVSAVMGFILGCVQLFLFNFMKNSGYQLMVLPMSGLIIGYLTNWLGIWMIFKPTHPHIPRIFCGYVNFQGVFLKRQQNVAVELSKMLSNSLLQSKEMIHYIVHNNKLGGGFQNLLELHRSHTHKAVDKIMGSIGRQFVIPLALGNEQYEELKDDIVKEMIATLPEFEGEFTGYADRVFALESTLSERLAKLPPDQFEGMLHPVFQEDEWMILLLGGVLGVLVGYLQGVALGA